MEFEPDPIIWRYLNLAKFIHLIAFRTLHFTRIDQFHDKFEGSYPVKNLKEWEDRSFKCGDCKNWRKFGCVSCWYQSDNESSAMWEIYGKNGQGIAIMSTVDSLDLIKSHTTHLSSNELNSKARMNTGLLCIVCQTPVR